MCKDQLAILMKKDSKFITIVFQILPSSNSCTKIIFALLVLWVLIITINNAVFSVTRPPGVNCQDCLLFLLHYCITVVIQMESGKTGKKLNQVSGISSVRNLFSALCDFIRSSLGLNKTPQLLLMQVTQIGRTGVLNLEPSLSNSVWSSSPSQTSNPISFLSTIPSLPSPN